jgi:hypothetical protein
MCYAGIAGFPIARWLLNSSAASLQPKEFFYIGIDVRRPKMKRVMLKPMSLENP